MIDRPRAVALISGRGSNLKALLDADLPVEWVRVVSNRPGVAGLEIAEAHGIPTTVLDHTNYSSREDFDDALKGVIDTALKTQDGEDYRSRGLVVLAGFMRILSPGFVGHFDGRMINIHPSLLPNFKGLHTHRQALTAQVSEHGCSVHWVTPELDHGPVIAQARVPVYPSDSEDELASRVLKKEHLLYPAVVAAWAEGKMTRDAEGVLRLPEIRLPEDA